MNCSYLKVLNVDILQANVFFRQNVLCIGTTKHFGFLVVSDVMHINE